MRHNEFIIYSFTTQQLLMCALLCHTPVMYHRYDVSVLHCGQSMCDNDGCTSFTSSVQCLLDNLSVINDLDIIQAFHCYRANLILDET